MSNDRDEFNVPYVRFNGDKNESLPELGKQFILLIPAGKKLGSSHMSCSTGRVEWSSISDEEIQKELANGQAFYIGSYLLDDRNDKTFFLDLDGNVCVMSTRNWLPGRFNTPDAHANTSIRILCKAEGLPQ